MSELKPIPTRYKGYHFRSRTEARWAVFFDFLGIPYEYEPQGYVLEGIPYLPDFWLPESECFVEIKSGDRDDRSLQKCKLLARLSGKRVFLYNGPPTREVISGIEVWYEPAVNETLDLEAEWIECPICGAVKPNGYVQFTCHPLSTVWIQNSPKWRIEMESKMEYRPKLPKLRTDSSRLRDAIEAARSAQFEFGQEGAG